MKYRNSRGLAVAVASLISTAACSHSSGGSDSVGVDNPVQAYVVDNSVLAFAAVAQTRLLLPVVLVPSMHAAAGITFELDTSVGARPHTYDYVIPLDSDGNGTKETTLSGKIVFSSDPFAGGALIAGFEATVQLTVTTGGGLEMFAADLEAFFDVNGGFRVSGMGTYDDSSTGSTVVIAVDPAHPLHIRTASSKPDRKPNACVWSVDGEAHVDASHADGDYSADWKFSPTSTLVQVVHAQFKQAGGKQKSLPDSKFEVGPCPGTGGLKDWVGHFTFDWFCIPPESGQSDLTITLAGKDRIQIADEDPPASGNILVYYARSDANNPHIVHGSFKESGGGSTYEEDFTWILSPDKQTFEQVSEYFYISGPQAGSGGDCGGTATRQ